MEPYGRGIPVFLIYQSGNQTSSSSVGSAGGATPTIHHPPVSHWFRMPSFRWGQVEYSDGGDDVDDDGGDDEEEGDDKAGSKNSNCFGKRRLTALIEQMDTPCHFLQSHITIRSDCDLKRNIRYERFLGICLVKDNLVLQ